jgi:hypothetical protein
MLRECRQDVNGQPVGLTEIDGNEVDLRFHESRDEVNVPSEPVQLGDDQECMPFAICIPQVPWRVPARRFASLQIRAP